MTALAMDVRELYFDEIDLVSGGDGPSVRTYVTAAAVFVILGPVGLTFFWLGYNANTED